MTHICLYFICIHCALCLISNFDFQNLIFILVPNISSIVRRATICDEVAVLLRLCDWPIRGESIVYYAQWLVRRRVAI